jgi:ribonuclease P protein component
VGRFSFPRAARLCHSSDFTRVYRSGVRLNVPPLRICALKCADGRSRLGLSISRKVGKATVRNSWKRAIREAFRINRHRLTAPWDLVVSVDWEADPEGVAGVEASLLKAVALLNDRADRGARR